MVFDPWPPTFDLPSLFGKDNNSIPVDGKILLVLGFEVCQLGRFLGGEKGQSAKPPIISDCFFSPIFFSRSARKGWLVDVNVCLSLKRVG